MVLHLAFSPHAETRIVASGGPVATSSGCIARESEISALMRDEKIVCRAAATVTLLQDGDVAQQVRSVIRIDAASRSRRFSCDGSRHVAAHAAVRSRSVTKEHSATRRTVRPKKKARRCRRARSVHEDRLSRYFASLAIWWVRRDTFRLALFL